MSFRILLTSLLLATTVLAQERYVRVVSPEIHADNTVTFRLRAPDAHSVTMYGDWGKEGGAMTNDDKGIWIITVGPLAPDIYSYSFTVDGVKMLDPSNSRVNPSLTHTDSVLDIPRDPLALWDRQPGVARGTVHLEDYYSKSLGRERRMRVYTPPGYDAAKKKKYPVLYLLHGSGDNEQGWTEYGRAHIILDNLVAQGKAVPMIVVMTDGHASRNYTSNTADYERDLFQDVMPLVEANYHAAKTPALRAIAGLSMGGEQSLVIGLNHLDTFAWVGGMSSGGRTNWDQPLKPFLSDPKASEEKLKLLWLSCGKDDRLLKISEALHDALTARGIPHEWVVTDGNHRWMVWRRNLAALVPQLFQTSKK